MDQPSQSLAKPRKDARAAARERPVHRNAICLCRWVEPHTMPGDRTAALRAAEKLLRLGKLQLAIAAYTSLVQEHPQDWDSAVLLATLHLRIRDVDGAVTRFADVGDALC